MVGFAGEAKDVTTHLTVKVRTGAEDDVPYVGVYVAAIT